MPKIFEESVLAGMTFSNRIIRAATHEGMADECGRPLEELAKVYTRLALGGGQINPVLKKVEAVAPSKG